MGLLRAALGLAKSLVERRDLLLENLALRQQLAVLKRTRPRPKLRMADRWFWVGLSRCWEGWGEALCLVKPETVIGWHRAGFRLLWRWRSGKGGRPPIDGEARALIGRIALENPTWGAPRIHGELLKLGHRLAESTVAAYLPSRRSGPRVRKPPSKAWRTFLRNHMHDAAAMDFLVIPTATFRQLYGFVVLGHGRRRIRHVAVTAHPTAEWTARQLREAFSYDTAPRFLHRDNDAIYGGLVKKTIEALGVEDVPSAPRSPWQNPYCERVIGTLRRELLDRVVVLNEAHARRLLGEYVAYYNGSRCHLGLAKDSPEGNVYQVPSAGPIHAREVLGGLHHVYERRAA